MKADSEGSSFGNARAFVGTGGRFGIFTVEIAERHYCNSLKPIDRQVKIFIVYIL